MLMVTKYQFVTCNTPTDLIQITINHLDSMCQMAQQTMALKLIEEAKAMFINVYAKMSQHRLQMIRYTILTYLQDIRTRVSIFLRDGTQENDGSFVIKAEGVVSCDCQLPGQIKYLDTNDQSVARIDTFDSMARYSVSNKNTDLGLNM